MSIPGIPGDRAAYDVIYRARWDGTDLTEGAAKARAEIEALQKTNSEYNKTQTQEARDASQSAKNRASAEAQLTRALKDQEAARILLNKAENNGYTSPEQYFQYRQRELQQQTLLNKARNNGRDTPDQAIADIKAETAAVEQKAKQVSTLAGFFEELATAQERSNTSDPFKGQAQKNLKSYAEQVQAVIMGLQSAVENDPFSNGSALKKASVNVEAFVSEVKKAINDVNNEVENIGVSTKGRSSSSFFSSFSNTTKDINRGLKGISDNAKKAAEDGGKSASDLDVAWSKFKYTLNAVSGSFRSIFNGSGGSGIGGGIGSLFASGSAAGGSFLSVLSAAIPAVTSLWGILAMGVTVFPLVISGILAIATGVIGLTASIGTLVSVAGAIIPIFVAFAGAALVLKSAIEPVVKAVSALGNATNSSQIQAALKGLSPAAQNAALALFTLEKAFKGTSSGLEQAFWTPLLPSLKNISEIAKPLNTLLKQIAGSLGNVLAQAVTGFEKFAQSTGFKTLTGGAVETVNNLGGAFVNLLDIITKLAVAGQPITNFITTGIDDLTKSLDRLITTASNNGSLNKFFDDVLHRMMLIGNIFSNFFGGMHNLFTAFLPVGDAFLQEIDGWAKRFDAFSKNRKALAEWAQDAIPFLKTLGDILANIVSGIVRLGSNPKNLKDLTDIFQGLSKIVNPLFSLIQALFDLFSRFATVAAPLIGNALSGFARAIQDVANWVRDIENHRLGIDALKTLLGVFGGLVVSASLVSFIGKLVALAGSSWNSLKSIFGFFGLGGGSSSNGNGGGSGGPAQAAADTQLRAAQMNLTASENNLRAAGLMETASTENVVAAEETGAAVAGGAAGGRSFGGGLLAALGSVGGFLTLIYGNKAVNSGTAPNTGGRFAGEAGADVTGGALIGGSFAGIPGAIVGGVIGGVKAIFDNSSYLNKLLNSFNPNANAQKNLYNGPVQGTFLTPKGTPIDPVTGLPTGQILNSPNIFNGTTITPEQLGMLQSTYNSQVPTGHAPAGSTILPTIQAPNTKTRTFLQPAQQPGDPRANPGFGYGSQDKPIISAHFLDPVIHFFSHDIEQWSKDAWHAVQDFFVGPFVRFFTDTIPHVAEASYRWFINQNKEIWHAIESAGLTAWHHIIDPVWQWFDRDVYSKVERFFVHDIPQWGKDIWHNAFVPAWQWFDKDVYRPVANFITKTLPNFFTQTIPKWWDSAYGWFMKSVGSPVANFVTKSIPSFFTQTIPKWWDGGYAWFMRDIGSPIANFVTKTIPGFFTQTIPHWFDNVGSWFNRSVAKPLGDFFSSIPGAVGGAFKSGLNWVIDHVIGGGPNPTSGIIGFLNKAAGVVGVHIPGLPHLAGGGKVPGPDYVDHDAVYAKLTPGEYVIRKKAAQHLGSGVLDWLNNADKHMPRFSGGGGVSGWLTGSSEAKAAVNAAKGAFGFVQGALRDGFDAGWGPLVRALLSPLGSDNVPASVGASTAGGIKNAVDSFLGKKDKSYFGSLGGIIATGIHKLLIDQALGAAHVPSANGNWAHWETGMNTLVQRESGWNSRAVNKSDSNATGPIQADGAPLNSSRGLAQTVPGTFNRYHVAGTSNDIYDPIANLAAAIKYIISRYGDISFVQQANANMPSKGYNTGGFVLPDFGGFAMPAPLRYAAGSPSRLSQAAQSINNSRSIGLNVENMNINNPVRETAGQSVQRQLVKNRTYAGRG